MANATRIVVTADWEVRQELRALGLTSDFVLKVAKAASAAKADTLPIDPVNAPGIQAYNYGVRAIRFDLLPEHWRMSRAGNMEATVNDNLGIQLCFQNVDYACGERDPEAISKKGSGARRLIRDGKQSEMFERPADPAASAYGSTPVVWVICVSTSEKKLRAEVSCPEIFEGKHFEGFSKRIFVVDEALDPTPTSGKKPHDGGGEDGDFEVKVVRK